MKGLSIFIVIILAVVVVLFLGWARAPDMLANNFSKKLGVSVSIDSLGIGLKHINVDEMEIGNPRGYSMPKAFSSKEIEVKAPLTRYLDDKIIIDEINVNDIYLGLEFDSTSGSDGNWKIILSNYNREGHLDEKKSKKSVLIRRLVLSNITTDIMFHENGGKVKRLPNIDKIVLRDISTEGGTASDQLMSSILGQMIKSVFVQQNLSQFLKGLGDPAKAVDSFLSPFKGIFNALPKPETDSQKERIA
ncbi:MAG: hypothetical protein K940chlam2_00127 [Chlamydiae bacterium]|nr:hypothetical protein [Chlamydiota bacterium]